MTDSLLCTPFIKILKDNTNAEVDLLSVKANSVIFQNNIYISRVIESEAGFFKLIKLIGNLRKSCYDAVIDLNENFSKKGAFTIGLLNSNFKIGLSKENNGLLTHIVPELNRIKVHKVDRMLNLAKPFEFSYSTKDLNIISTTTQESDKIVLQFMKDNNIAGKLLVCINISNDDNTSAWGIDNFKSIVKYISDYNVNIIVTSSIYEVTRADKIAESGYYTYYNTDFITYSSLIKFSDFIFTPDSYTVHLAAAFKKPVFILFKQNKPNEMLKVPYNSDFDFVQNSNDGLSNLSYGKVLNSFIPYFDYVFERFSNKID